MKRLVLTVASRVVVLYRRCSSCRRHQGHYIFELSVHLCVCAHTYMHSWAKAFSHQLAIDFSFIHYIFFHVHIFLAVL